MAKDLLLDQYHDLALVNGDFQVVSGINEIAQQLRIHLLTIRYEWFLDGTLGIPWNDGMLGSAFSKEQRELEVRREALKVDGIRSIKRLVYGHDRQTGGILITIEATSDFGPLTDSLGA